MKNLKKSLLIEQLDKKMEKMAVISDSDMPPRGWIYTIRTTLNMSLAQLGKRLNITPQSVREIEERERNKSLTLKRFLEVAEVFNLRFVYGFVPKYTSLETMIEERAFKIATDIIMRSSHNMTLEDQKNSEARLQKAIMDRTGLIKQELPRYLWD